ncbi:SIMPL domain-containing protein [Altererythrobacter sp. H2]|uniref:SIMPL domain-containing protein n=1 Tax=Altererythrobacter sp. H2 TaxID=3108391 RepID=UPI002B4BCC3E|nr:SIMPL domain-containing protein [Altererythrobacter sp. H2]WRK96928.1 SIMPL domain-containing protein [Altererythrobacter sp. H2]
MIWTHARTFLAGTAALSLAACAPAKDDARGVDRSETLLSVSASGQAESRPDRAQFQAGIETWARTAKEASQANGRKITEIVAALRELGIAEADIQTRAVNVQRIDWGDRKGQFQASNVVEVTIRDVSKASDAVLAATEAGANIISGPNLSMSDPEATANIAYASAYKAARKRAEAYAEAADMEIARVLYIRDAGGSQGQTWLRGADAAYESAAMAPPPPPVNAVPRPEQGGAGMMVGSTRSDVTIQVDFALKAK